MSNVELQRRAARLVSQEVNCCMSSLVATLGRADYHADDSSELERLKDQALELACPVADYESAAREAGWDRTAEPAGFRKTLWTDGNAVAAMRNNCADATPKAWETLCNQEGIEPHELEVFEHWAVSSWLADKLEDKGERIDRDFAGLIVWARTTSGQAISIDSVIEAIVSETGYASGETP